MIPEHLIAESGHGTRLSPVEALGQSQQPRGEFRPADGPGQLQGAVSVSPEVHGLGALMDVYGFHVKFCLCGAPSKPFVTLERAREARCPREESEAEIARNSAWVASALAHVHAFERGR